MVDVIKDWKGETVRLLPGSYWHLFWPGGLLKHNARLGHGVIVSMGFLAEMPGLENVVSPFFMGP